MLGISQVHGLIARPRHFLKRKATRMGDITIWIEGEKNLENFCKRRFGQQPRFVETIGRVGPATVHLKYKWRDDKQRYVAMFLLFMEHQNGTCHDINEEGRKTYEEIRRTKGSILDV